MDEDVNCWHQEKHSTIGRFTLQYYRNSLKSVKYVSFIGLLHYYQICNKTVELTEPEQASKLEPELGTAQPQLVSVYCLNK